LLVDKWVNPTDVYVYLLGLDQRGAKQAPPALWLLSSGLLGLVGLRRCKKS